MVKLKVDELLEQKSLPTDVGHDDDRAEIAAA
jgi:hypothetical protein